MNQLEIWAQIAQAAINFIVVNQATSGSQKATVTDMKTDLRSTKVDLMNEIKEGNAEVIRILLQEFEKDKDRA